MNRKTKDLMTYDIGMIATIGFLGFMFAGFTGTALLCLVIAFFAMR
jgi:hypothetical protein